MTVYKILGPRVLLKVTKMTFEEYMKENALVEGSSIIQTANTKTKEQHEDDYQTKVATQTKAEIEDIGEGVQEIPGFELLKKGDKVHFQRYGAVRLNSDKQDTVEYWVVNGKDLLVIEEAKDNV